AWADGVVRALERGDGPVPELVPRAQRRVQLDPGRVDEVRRRGLQEDAGDHSDALVSERSGDLLQELRLADDVVVHEHEDVAVELERRPVDRGAETEVLLVANDAHLRM